MKKISNPVTNGKTTLLISLVLLAVFIMGVLAMVFAFLLQMDGDFGFYIRIVLGSVSGGAITALTYGLKTMFDTRSRREKDAYKLEKQALKEKQREENHKFKLEKLKIKCNKKTGN